jgi:hypothetical protein
VRVEGVRVKGVGLRVEGAGLRVWGVGLRVRGITFIFSMLADTPGFPPGNTTPEPWTRLPKVNQPCTAAIFKSQQHSEERSIRSRPPPAIWRGTFGVQFSISEQLLSRNVERFRGGLVVKAHRSLYHSTLGSRVMKKKNKYLRGGSRLTD